ncbi:uncharacterized protein EV154DRAFT_488541 [Mucor mucedo]|uniref:uncharacterized protein n=1 Tax=Mucor mucedo TaxID=29922 RepID=UPI00221E5DA5|nr:uncharacterized protein EV154DRAFT_488541 [Mucor mucedo]KAI7866495.1 hypothetical protein EV154DRAFT_488541 [Mucor mucedo]
MRNDSYRIIWYIRHGIEILSQTPVVIYFTRSCVTSTQAIIMLVADNHAKCLRPLLKPDQPIGPVRPVPPVPCSLPPVTHVTVKHHYCILSNACVPNNVSPLSLVLVKPFNMRFACSCYPLYLSAKLYVFIPATPKMSQTKYGRTQANIIFKKKSLDFPHLRGYKLLISLFNTPIVETDSKAMTPLEQHWTKRKCGRLKNGLHV